MVCPSADAVAVRFYSFYKFRSSDDDHHHNSRVL
jgi:hypothetical protein